MKVFWWRLFAFALSIVLCDEDIDDSGALFLTPYIELGKIKEAQLASFVKPILGNVTSYSGYLTVDKEANSNYFFWYFPNRRNSQSEVVVPVLLWLQGGQIYSDPLGLFGLFYQNGPYTFRDKRDLALRSEYYWTENFNVLYVDAPIGTGYSFTKKSNGYETTSEQTADHLLEVVSQFFRLFPNLSSNSFYIAGEFNGAKYSTLLAERIKYRNEEGEFGRRINLKGLIMFSPFLDPKSSLAHSSILYQAGLVDSVLSEGMRAIEMRTRELILAGDYKKASKWWHKLNRYVRLYTRCSIWDFSSTGPYIYEMKFYLFEFLNEDRIRESLHVGKIPYQRGYAGIKSQHYDIARSVSSTLEKIANTYKVLFCSGQFDVITGYPLVQNMLRNLQLKDLDLYLETPREKWYVGNQLAGYRKQKGNLMEKYLLETRIILSPCLNQNWPTKPSNTSPPYKIMFNVANWYNTS